MEKYITDMYNENASDQCMITFTNLEYEDIIDDWYNFFKDDDILSYDEEDILEDDTMICKYCERHINMCFCIFESDDEDDDTSICKSCKRRNTMCFCSYDEDPDWYCPRCLNSTCLGCDYDMGY